MCHRFFAHVRRLSYTATTHNVAVRRDAAGRKLLTGTQYLRHFQPIVGQRTDVAGASADAVSIAAGPPHCFPRFQSLH